MGKFILPKIKGVTIQGFSLYKLKDEIKLEINNGVFCLAGANGLGKSTFISILSYAILGIVVNPKKSFSSINRIPKFFKESEKFASTYFKGRISEANRDTASVEVSFLVGDNLYTIKRLFFDNSGLVSFSRINIVEGRETIIGGTSSSLSEQYRAHFVKDVGLDSFEQFSFIHSFVLTFDESKQLLFWDDALMNRVLYIFFGVDPQEAEKADDLRKDIARHGSYMRNVQWEITQATRSLKELMQTSEQELINSEEIEATKTRLEELENALKELKEALSISQSEYKETLSIINDRSIKIANLKMQYENEFNNLYSFNNIPVEKDDTVIEILRLLTKNIAAGDDVSSEIDRLIQRIKKIHEQHKNHPKAYEILKEIDKGLLIFESELKENYSKKERLEKEISQGFEMELSIRERIEKFNEENEGILKKAYASKNKNYVEEIKALESLINKKEIQKQKETELRDNKLAQLEVIEARITDNYHVAREGFIPMFKEHANSFLGLDIDIDFRRTDKGPSLILKVNDTERTRQYQLSESQRYFIDIALRFALIEYVSDQSYILIDTPEGSLDIAYENRAGKMFADFVLKGYDVIMTANINSSQLLLQMAEKCGASMMHLERMTNWTILSSVQQEEHQIIERAFNNIEETLVRYDA